MTAFATLALLATAQGGFKPPTGPIVFPQYVVRNLIANPGFESASFAPWWTGGELNYYDDDGSILSQSMSGYVSGWPTHSGSGSFEMNARFPGYASNGAGVGAMTYVEQDLQKPSLGSAILGASVWVYSMDQLRVTIRYTAGPDTYAERAFGGSGWELWNFRNALDPARTVKSIRIWAIAPFYNSPMASCIDDVNVSVVARI